MTTETDVDVLIVGLGPVGLTLAALLGRRGLRVEILEREPEFYGMARAVYTDDECMRALQEGGIADELSSEMSIDGAIQWVRANGSVLARFAVTHRPNGWPISNFLYQPYLENALEAVLARYPNVRVSRGRSVTQITQDASSATVTHVLSHGTGYGTTAPQLDESEARTLSARYVIACDGGRSTVRAGLGISMHGTRFPERWLVVDLATKENADAFRHLPYFNFHCDPELPTVSCPQPGGHHRFEFMVRDEQTKEQMEDPATVRALIARFVDPDKVTVVRKLVYTFNAVVAERWRGGRVLLAGDAAHMTPQFIGQGMSSGIRDAQNLAWKLDLIVNQGVDDGILDSYELERRPHAKLMIDFSVQMKDFVSISSPAKAAVRNLLMTLALRLPGFGAWVSSMGMKPRPKFVQGQYLGMRRSGLRAVEGTLAPQPQVRLYNGSIRRFDDVVGSGFVLIGLGNDPRTQLSAEERLEWERVGTRFVAIYPIGGRPQGHTGDAHVFPDLVDLEDVNGDFIRWMRRGGARSGTKLVALRPDKFVFGIDSPSALTRVLATSFVAATAAVRDRITVTA